MPSLLVAGPTKRPDANVALRHRVLAMTPGCATFARGLHRKSKQPQQSLVNALGMGFGSPQWAYFSAGLWLCSRSASARYRHRAAFAGNRFSHSVVHEETDRSGAVNTSGPST